MSNSNLPFLVIHGALVWKLALAAVFVVTSALMWRMRRRPLAAVLVGVVATAIALKAELVLGDSWHDRCRELGFRQRHDTAPIATSPIDTAACERAAATPRARDAALTAMLQALSSDTYRDDASMHRLYALSELVEGCDGWPARLLGDARYDDAIAAARACHDPRTEHLALRDAGRVAEAVTIAVPETTDLVALPRTEEWILTDHWAEAARAADHRADGIHAKARNDPSADLTALHYRCVAELFRSYAGDQAAEVRLRALQQGAHGDGCNVVLAQIAPDPERSKLLAQDVDDGLRETLSIRHRLRWLDGGEQDLGLTTPEMLLADPASLAVLADPAAAERVWLAATVPSAPGLSTSMLQWQTAAQVVSGDLDRARVTAAAAAAAGAAASGRVATNASDLAAEQRDLAQLGREIATAQGAHDARRQADVSARLTALEARIHATEAQVGKLDPSATPAEQDLPLLPAVIALRTTSTALVTPADTGEDKLSGRDSRFGPLWLRTNDTARLTSSPLLADTAAAAGGDGTALARSIVEPGFSPWTDAQVMAVLPRLTTGRDAVIRLLTWSPPLTSMSREDYPWSIALRAATRRDLFRVAGVPAEAARWDTIYQRFDKLLRDRRRVIALMLWELE